MALHTSTFPNYISRTTPQTRESSSNTTAYNVTYHVLPQSFNPGSTSLPSVEAFPAPTLSSPEPSNMAFQPGTVEEFILWLCWAMLSLSPRWAVNPVFYRIFAAKQEMAACLLESTMHFAPGLFDIIRSETPPTIDFFKSLPAVFIKRWGIYVLVLEKKNSISKIYIGAGTEKRSGVATRMGQYRRGENFAANVQKALDDGYQIVHMGLLCWVPLPSASARIRCRTFILILEAGFTLWFWAIASHSADYGMPVAFRPWEPVTLTYQWCYGHFSLREGAIELKNDLSPDEINAIEAERRLKNSRRDSKVRGPERTNESARRTRQRSLAAKKWFCNVCSVNFGSGAQLRHHETLQKHADNVAGIIKPVKNPRTKARNQENFDSKRYHCSICNYTAKTQQKLNFHLMTKKHERKVASLSS